ncbi:MAG: response regulator [Alphaproteobacteria bacterium]|nr:response regulator [Alphaproteobacteria bacterium]
MSELSHSKVVLGVDDSPEDLGLLNLILMGAGYTFVASAPADCFNLVLRCAPRLILLDIQMPELDGFEACRRLRSMPEARHIPIAFLTASKTRQDVTRGLEVGGNDFLIKPFERDKLLARVHHWTNRRL